MSRIAKRAAARFMALATVFMLALGIGIAASSQEAQATEYNNQTWVLDAITGLTDGQFKAGSVLDVDPDELVAGNEELMELFLEGSESRIQIQWEFSSNGSSWSTMKTRTLDKSDLSYTVSSSANGNSKVRLTVTNLDTNDTYRSPGISRLKTTVNKVTITTNLDDIRPIINETSAKPTVTFSIDDVSLNQGSCYWQKYNESSGSWEAFSSNSSNAIFTAGKYRYHFSFMCNASNVNISDPVTIVVDGKSQTDSPLLSGSLYYFGANSTEYIAEDSGQVYHTVTFETNGGSTISSVMVTHGQTVTKPTDPKKLDYTFAG